MPGRKSLRLASLPEPDFDPDEARRVVEDVLARAEYAGLEPGLLQRALDRVLTQIGRGLSALEGTGFGTALGILVLLAALALGGWLVVRFLGGVRRDPGGDVTVADEVGRSPTDWLAQAQRHEREGRLREAVRARYRGLVAALSAMGIVEEMPGRTTGEYLDEVRRQAPGAASPFVAVIRAFEEAWYGDADLTAGDLQGVRDAEAAVMEKARSRAAARARPPAPVAAGAGAAPEGREGP